MHVEVKDPDGKVSVPGRGSPGGSGTHQAGGWGPGACGVPSSWGRGFLECMGHPPAWWGCLWGPWGACQIGWGGSLGCTGGLPAWVGGPWSTWGACQPGWGVPGVPASWVGGVLGVPSGQGRGSLGCPLSWGKWGVLQLGQVVPGCPPDWAWGPWGAQCVPPARAGVPWGARCTHQPGLGGPQETWGLSQCPPLPQGGHWVTVAASRRRWCCRGSTALKDGSPSPPTHRASTRSASTPTPPAWRSLPVANW